RALASGGLGPGAPVLVGRAAARAGALRAGRLGRPAVIGQLLAGVVIGPTVLGSRSDDLLSEDTVRVVRDLGTVGLVAFAFALGARLDRHHLPRPHRFAAMAAAVFGVPFLAGIAVGFWLFAD